MEYFDEDTLIIDDADEMQDITSSLLPDHIDRLLIINSKDENPDKIIYELVIERSKLELKEIEGDQLSVYKLDYKTGNILKNERDDTGSLMDFFQDKISHILEDISLERTSMYEI